MLDVSVIIPTYNRARELLRALDSVEAQREEPTEVIIVDDGSTDATFQVVKEFSGKSRLEIRYHFQPNRGPAAARNAGIARSACQYLAFLDSDDEWHRDKLPIQQKAMEAASEYLISHTKERWLRNDQHLNQKKYHHPPGGDIFAQSLRLCCVGMSTVMVRRQLFKLYGPFDETLRCCEDYDLWLRVSAGERFYLIDRAFTVKHGGRPDQVSNRYSVGMDRFRIQALAKLLGSDLLPEQKQLACRELVRRCAIYGHGCEKYDKEEEAAFYVRLADYCESRRYGQ